MQAAYKRQLTQSKVNDMIYGRVPPQAREMEQAVLGACMIQINAFNEVLELLDENCFYVESHRLIFRAMADLSSKSQPIDLNTVQEQLKTNGDLETIGGGYYLSTLTNSVVSSANIVSHSRYILQAYMKREVIRTCGELISEGYEDMTDAFELLEKADNSLLKIRQRVELRTYKPIDTILVETIKHLESIRHRQDHLTGVTSGFKELDRVTCGWQDTDLIILAARPSVGKTSFALALARNASKSVPVGFFSCEMSDRQLIQRVLAAETGLPLWHLRDGKLTDEGMKNLYEQGVVPVAQDKIFVDDTANIGLSELKAKARRMVTRDGVKIIFIDYLQLITTDQQFSRKDLEIGFISSQLKGLAKDLKIPIVCLSQLSRDVEKRGDPEPKLSDLRESGAIEQDADIVIFLWKPTDSEIAENIELNQYCHVKIEKNRNGTLEKFLAKFLKETQKWEYLKILGVEGLPIGGNWKPVKDIL